MRWQGRNPLPLHLTNARARAGLDILSSISYYEGITKVTGISWESGEYLIIHFVRHYEPMKKITGKVGGSMEIFLILIIICLLLGIVSPSSSSKKKSDKLPPDFFDNYYKRNKD